MSSLCTLALDPLQDVVSSYEFAFRYDHNIFLKKNGRESSSTRVRRGT